MRRNKINKNKMGRHKPRWVEMRREYTREEDTNWFGEEIKRRWEENKYEGAQNRVEKRRPDEETQTEMRRNEIRRIYRMMRHKLIWEEMRREE